MQSSIDMLTTATAEDGYRSRCKKFLFRLLQALHSAGNLSYKTESVVEKIARCLNMNATCTVFPLNATISFNPLTQLTASSSESYTFRTEPGINCSKLALLNQLCFDMTHGKAELEIADGKLQEIEDLPLLYSWHVICCAYGVSSLTATTLFFWGSWVDGALAFLLGIVVYFINYFCSLFPGLSEIEGFISSFVVTVMACVLDKFIFSDNLCLYGVVFGAIVSLLPGITITIAVLEIYSKMIVYGSSRLIYGISLASQLGFGVTSACALIIPSALKISSFQHGCSHPVPHIFDFVLLALTSISNAVLNNSDISQMPGMLLVAVSGHFANFLMVSFNTSPNVTPLIGSLVVTAVARLYAHYSFDHHRPLIYIIAGLLILVPGGLSVQSMASVWSGEAGLQTGFDLTFKVLMVGISLAIGVFLALLPNRSWLGAFQSRLERLWTRYVVESGNSTTVMNSSTSEKQDLLRDAV